MKENNSVVVVVIVVFVFILYTCKIAAYISQLVLVVVVLLWALSTVLNFL